MSTNLFDRPAQVLQAMAHPRRLEIINLLRDDELSVTQIQNMLALRQAYLSQHLMVLREAHVLESQKRGKEIFYRIANKNIIKASDDIREILGIEDQLDIKSLTPLVIDPVCKMRVSSKYPGGKVTWKNETFYFCATGCMKKFNKQPEKFV